MAVLLGWFALMFIANSYMPLYRDDYWAGLIWKTGEHLQSMNEVFISLERYYMMHGGRLVSFFFQFVFMMGDKIWFNLANAFVFSAMCALIVMHARRKLSCLDSPKMLLVAGAFLWFGLSHFGEVAIWLCGSTVYLWTGLLTALFLLPYNVALAGTLQSSSWLTIIILPLGMIAACSVENLTVTTTLLVIWCTWYAKSHDMCAPWMLLGAVGSLIGSIVCIIAPGNYVRYDDQSSPFLQHIGNQFAGNGEMILYILPVILLLNLSYRILQAQLLKQRGIRLAPVRMEGYRTKILLLLLIVLLVISYFNGSFVANAIRDACVFAVLSPIGLTDEKTISHFDNVMAGFEEMAIYWLAVFLIFFSVRQALGFHKENRMLLKKSVSFSDLFFFCPSVRYACFLFFLAFFNNFVMIAAPTFPARATFSSVCMILMGFVAIFSLDEISSACSGQVSKHVLLAGALCLGVYCTAYKKRMQYGSKSSRNRPG